MEILETALFYVATFGAFYGVGGFISDLLDRVGIWPLEEKETTQKPCSEIDSQAFYERVRHSPTPSPSTAT